MGMECIAYPGKKCDCTLVNSVFLRIGALGLALSAPAEDLKRALADYGCVPLEPATAQTPLTQEPLQG